MNFADNIKKLRGAKNISQEQLAHKLDVSRQAVSRWESGESFPEMDKILRIRALFDVSLDELLGSADLDVIEKDDKKRKRAALDKAYRRLAITTAILTGLLVTDIGFSTIYFTGSGNSLAEFWFDQSFTFVLVVLMIIYASIPFNSLKKSVGKQAAANLYSEKEIVKGRQMLVRRLLWGLFLVFSGLFAVFTTNLNPENEYVSSAKLVAAAMFIACSVGVALITHASILYGRFFKKKIS
ncbi:helix-turn-helix domain-containing protein [Candidatus Saccharibacteria bacterium]|nr:helix-turn-helix domain-containing protein [Candidatus Saccharibacteria bacterium]